MPSEINATTIYRKPRLRYTLALVTHPKFPSLSYTLAVPKIYASEKHYSCKFCESIFYAKNVKMLIRMNSGGLKMYGNIKVIIPCVRIVAIFALQIWHLPR